MTKSNQRGFTLIELLLLSVVVGILGTLVGLTYHGVQAQDRNKDRKVSIKLIQSFLETYYAQYTQYPTGDNLADATWRKTNLKDMAADALRDPQWNKDIAACAAKGEAVPANGPTEKCYSYQVTAADGSACDNAKTPCSQYTLTATLEGGDKYVKASLN